MRLLTRQYKLLGVLFLALVVIAVWFTYATFAKKFTEYDEVKVETSKIGLQLPMRADVKIRGVIVGEVLGSKAGMGSLINHAYGLFRTADYVALVVVTLVLIIASDAVAGAVEHRARRWTS